MRVAGALAALSLLGSLAFFSDGFSSDDTALMDVRQAIRKDHEASMRYLAVLLEREQRVLKRGTEAQAIQAERECLRHEIKCLDRCVWYMRHDHSLADKARALASALAELRKKDPKASLEDRKKSGFKMNDLVADPLGVSVAAGEKTGRQTTSPGTPARAAPVHEPEPEREPARAAAARRQPVKPPSGPPPAPPPEDDAGSAGSPGMGGH